MNISTLKKALADAGFVRETTDDEGYPALEFRTYSDSGTYVGDLLKKNGFVKTNEIERGMEWVTFRDGTSIISHISGATLFCAAEEENA